MATRKIKINDNERLDSIHIERVILLLEPTEENVKPGTKKDACAILNIAYNTTRLAKIIQEYKDKKAKDAERRAALRGKPASEGEIQYIIGGYLEGGAVDTLAKSIYRSADFVKKVLIQYNVPIRNTGGSYFDPPLLPEETVRKRFKLGEVVYSARYDSTAKVFTEELHKSGVYVYRIWLISDRWKEYAYQPAEELASLEHLTILGVKL